MSDGRWVYGLWVMGYGVWVFATKALRREGCFKAVSIGLTKVILCFSPFFCVFKIDSQVGVFATDYLLQLGIF